MIYIDNKFNILEPELVEVCLLNRFTSFFNDMVT